MHQLGMTHLVYRGATHRRIEHALGAVGVAQRMLEAVTHNCLKRKSSKVDPKDQCLLGHPPTDTEKRFVRLAALLHDIGHVPFGHTIEDELRLLRKHDGEERLSRIFEKKVWHGKEMRTLSEMIDALYTRYMPEGLPNEYKASDLLRRLIVSRPKDHDEKRRSRDREVEQVFADVGFRIGICRDIVGDTICADLLDYLHRDWYHIGKPRAFDERILQYMEIRTPTSNVSMAVDGMPKPSADDVFVVSIGNRPKLRTDGISEILSLLESRYELAEAVLFHRAKMNATAMLERALSLAMPTSQTEADLEGWLLDNPEEVLIPALIEGKGPVEESKLQEQAKENFNEAQDLGARLLRRDLYDLLLMVTYDEFEGRDVDYVQEKYGDGKDAAVNRANALRLLESDFGLKPGSIVMYCPESRMNSKIAQVQIFVEGIVCPFDEYERRHDDELSAGHLRAQLNRFKRLWKIMFFIAPEVTKEKGEEFLLRLREAIRVLVLNIYPRGESVETITASIARGAVLIDTFHLYGGTPLSSPKELRVARGDPSVVDQRYPTNARSLRSFIEIDEHSNDTRDSRKGSFRA